MILDGPGASEGTKRKLNTKINQYHLSLREMLISRCHYLFSPCLVLLVAVVVFLSVSCEGFTLNMGKF
jgi:hypothetical protein